MNIHATYGSSLFRSLRSIVGVTLVAALVACAEDVTISDVKVAPEEAAKGESLPVEGVVTSVGGPLTSITYSVVDGTGKTPEGLSVSSNALAKEKSSWGLPGK